MATVPEDSRLHCRIRVDSFHLAVSTLPSGRTELRLFCPWCGTKHMIPDVPHVVDCTACNRVIDVLPLVKHG